MPILGVIGRNIDIRICSRDYISKRVLCGSWFTTPQKELQKLMEKFRRNFISSRDGSVESTEARQGGEKLINTNLLQNNGRFLSGLQHSALGSRLLCYLHNKVN